MSSQKAAGGTQSTLLSFFGKPASSSGATPASSSSAASRQTPASRPLKTPTSQRASTSAGSSTSKATTTSGSKGKETPATSEGDILTLDDSDAAEEHEDKVKVRRRVAPPALTVLSRVLC